MCFELLNLINMISKTQRTPHQNLQKKTEDYNPQSKLVALIIASALKQVSYSC